MFVWIARWVVNAIALYIVASVVPGIHLTNFAAALIAVALLSLINLFLRPVLFLLTLPVTILTLGLFSLVLNALLFLLAGAVTSGFRVDGFFAAFLGSIVFSVLSVVFHTLVR